MASTALTVFVGYAPLWYGGAAAQVAPDATRIAMSLVHEVERKLPGRAVFDVSLSFCRDTTPQLEQLAQVALTHGYRLVHHSLSISYADTVPVWRFCVIALDRSRSTSPARLAHELSRSDEVVRFSIVPLKN